MKKKILLTCWLACPILIVIALMGWIFVSLNNPKPMMDLPAKGAGAGDTGGVNAIGEMLYGNDPDAIQHAKRMQREQLPMDPRDWPGGVQISVPFDAFDERVDDAVLTLFHDERPERTLVQYSERTDDAYVFVIEQESLKGSRFVVWTETPMLISNEGYHTNDNNRLLQMFEISEQVPSRQIEVSQPWAIDVQIDSVYEETP